MDRLLPESLRGKLKEPFGVLYPDIASMGEDLKEGFIVSVGDKVTENLLKAGFEPDLCVYDGKTQRHVISTPKEIEGYKAVEVRVRNPPGEITGEADKALKDAISSRKKTKIMVDGEEDLLTLTAITYAPEGALVLYGQPNEGVVLVKTDSKAKEKARNIIDEMTEK